YQGRILPLRRRYAGGRPASERCPLAQLRDCHHAAAVTLPISDDDCRQASARDLAGVGQLSSRLFEIVSGLKRLRSRPSRRNSAIRPVRSRYAPARRGSALITAPASMRMSVSISAIGPISSTTPAKALRNTAT